MLLADGGHMPLQFVFCFPLVLAAALALVVILVLAWLHLAPLD
jgi:hypothetical protein